MKSVPWWTTQVSYKHQLALLSSTQEYFIFSKHTALAMFQVNKLTKTR